jgi:hypothetical protein
LARGIAAFLCFHVAAITLRALPAPDGAMDRAAWSDPTVKQELAAWNARLGHLGLHLTPEQLADGLYALAHRYLGVRDALVSPFGRYYACCGTFQSWQMFVAPHRHPARLRIDVEEGGAWRTVFRERDPDATWLEPELSDTRFRSVIFRLAWPGYRGQLERFADWVARRATPDFPRAQRVRVVLSRAETPSAAETRAGVEAHEVDDAPLVRELGKPR